MYEITFLQRRFLTAALGTFGVIRMSNNIDETPSEMRRKFSEVNEERNIMLHDKLEKNIKYRYAFIQIFFYSF